MLTCYRTRRRIGAYLDQALDERAAAKAAAHIGACARCHAEVEGLRRLSVLLRRSIPQPPVPDWTGFWEGVRRSVEAPRVGTRVRPRPRFVFGTAAAAAAAMSLVVWQGSKTPFLPEAAAISVSSANTAHPRGTVMVYSPPERDLAVVWLFAED